MYVLVQCAVCRQRKGQQNMETWNGAPVCRSCYGAIVAIQFDKNNPREDHEEALALLDKATSRALAWVTDNADMLERKAWREHDYGVTHLRAVFKEENND